MAEVRRAHMLFWHTPLGQSLPWRHSTQLPLLSQTWPPPAELQGEPAFWLL